MCSWITERAEIEGRARALVRAIEDALARGEAQHLAEAVAR